MEASIKEGNIRHFVRLLQCASKFGDDLHMCANKEVWELAVTNSTKSAFCLFKLRPAFFCRYRALGPDNAAKRRGVKCQLLVKSVLSVLGKASSIANVERVDLTIVDPDSSLRNKRKRSESNIPRDEDEYNDEESEEEEVKGIEAKLILKLVCKHGVTKKHSLHLGSSPFLRAEVNPDSTPSSFDVSARALKDILDHFSFSAPGFPNANATSKDNQLGWLFALNEIRMKSWESGSSSLQTEVKIDPEEFDQYVLYDGDRVDLTVPMKEFRAALLLAEQLNIRLTVAYSEPSQPLTITSADENAPHFEIFCAIATTTCEAFANVTLPEAKVERASTAAKSEKTTAGRLDASARTTHGSTPNATPSASRAQKQRSTLSLSSRQQGPSASAILQPVSNDTTHDHSHDQSEPLFLPGGSQLQSDSQHDPSDFNAEMQAPPASQSQRVKMSQQEALDIGGFGDIDIFQLAGELDDADEEDAEELSNTQRLAQALGGNVMDQTIDGASSIHPQEGGKEMMDITGMNFEMDDSVFEGGGSKRKREDLDETTADLAEEMAIAEEEDRRRVEEQGPGNAANMEEDDEMFEEDDLLESQHDESTRTDGRTFTKLFDDD